MAVQPGGNLKTGPGRKPKDRFSHIVACFNYIEKRTKIFDQLFLHSLSATLFSYAKIQDKQIFSRHVSFVILK